MNLNDIKGIIKPFILDITITDYTRVTENSAICINNIITNFSTTTTISEVTDIGISDHYAQHLAVHTNETKTTKNTRFTKNFNLAGFDKLCKNLAKKK